MVHQPIERGSTEPTVDAVRSAGHDLLREIWQHLPRTMQADDHAWRASGIAMLARIADVVESVLVLTDAGQAVDASTLARVLYEAVQLRPEARGRVLSDLSARRPDESYGDGAAISGDAVA